MAENDKKGSTGNVSYKQIAMWLMAALFVMAGFIVKGISDDTNELKDNLNELVKTVAVMAENQRGFQSDMGHRFEMNDEDHKSTKEQIREIQRKLK